MLAIAVTGAVQVDPRAILDKLNRVRTWTISPDVPEDFYDPFVHTAPLLKTAHPVKPSSPPPTPRVDASFNDRAHIDGRWVGAGDKVQAYRVWRVRKDGVWLQGAKRRIFVPITHPKKYINSKGVTP